MTAAQILNISENDPERLFNIKEFTYQSKKLKSQWFPDRNTDPQSNTVFVHISTMIKVATRRIETKTWNGPNSISFTTDDYRDFNLTYSKIYDMEFGKMYIGKTIICYVFTEDNKDLYQNGLAMIKKLKYRNKEFEKQFKQYFPKIRFSSKTNIGYVVVMDKPKGAALLQDVIDIQPNNTIIPKQTAWIVGAMYNISVFLDSINIVHNAILPNTVFIDPITHMVMLYGGWWYARPTDSKMTALPSKLISILPNEVIVNKKAKSIYDRLAIKATGIGCLGDPSLIGSKLLMNKDIPKLMLLWLRSPSTNSALEEYEGWYTTLQKCFGKRKFVKMDFDINKLY